MSHYIIKRLQDKWQGPTIEIKIGEKVSKLGLGEPKALVDFRKTSVIARFAKDPSLAFGEAYMKGDIEVKGDLSAVLQGFHSSNIQILPKSLSAFQHLGGRATVRASKAKKNAQHHYDIGNDFYELWLDKSRTYSCAYYENGTETLEQAQLKKLDLICRKLRLEPGQKLLDIGSGWGSLLFHAAEHYGVEVTGVTPAREQAAFIRAEAERRGLSNKITVIEDDWRSLGGSYDRISSVGMFEHVGTKQYTQFFKIWDELLAPDGISLLHTIGRQTPAPPDPWIDKYIFPGAALPSISEMALATEKVNLTIYRIENLRPHYSQTLNHWRENFDNSIEKVKDMFDEEFIRMWRLYLLGSEAGFRHGKLELYQLELYGPKAKWPSSRQLTAGKVTVNQITPTDR